MYKKDTSCHIFICNNLNIRGWFESQPNHQSSKGEKIPKIFPPYFFPHLPPPKK